MPTQINQPPRSLTPQEYGECEDIGSSYHYINGEEWVEDKELYVSALFNFYEENYTDKPLIITKEQLRQYIDELW